MNAPQTAATAPQQESSSSPMFSEHSIFQITGAELAVVRSLIQRNHDELLSRLRDCNVGLGALDGVVARFAQQKLTAATVPADMPKER